MATGVTDRLWEGDDIVALVEVADRPAGKRAPTKGEARSSDLLSLSAQDMRGVASREAVESLGLLKPEAASIIASLIPDPMTEHPRAICVSYRRAGEQMSATEKRAIGIDSNGFMSRSAYAEVSDAGRGRALVAHEITLLRATFTYKRYKDILAARSLPISAKAVSLKFDATNIGCNVCAALDGKVVEFAGAYILPPLGCACETANYMLSIDVDWLADLD